MEEQLVTWSASGSGGDPHSAPLKARLFDSAALPRSTAPDGSAQGGFAGYRALRAGIRWGKPHPSRDWGC